jgi:mannose-6-phosphate isomerase-like protein (cupin superfamily)
MTVPNAATNRLADGVLAPAGSAIVLAEWTAAASSDGVRAYQAPLHRHPEAEAWYVLEGVLGVRVGDTEVEVRPGGAVVVPGDTPHTFWNRHPETARYVLVMGVKTYALIEAIHSSDDRSPEVMRKLFEEHGATLLGP